MEEEAGRADAVVIALPGKQVAGDDAAVEESLPFADPAKRAEMVKYATRALFAVAVAYIMTLIQAIPISMNFQVTGTSIPTSVTTLHLGLGAFAFRIAAVLFGNAIALRRHVRSPAMALLGGVRVHSLLRRVLDSLVSPFVDADNSDHLGL